MRTFLLSVLILILGFSQQLVGQDMAQKYVLLEHFTNASCPPCADQNPIFKDYYVEKGGNLHHISYHTSWPGFDPMYNANPSEVDTRVSVYGVSGVPTLVIAGLEQTGPANISDNLVSDAAEGGSPVRISVNETTEGSTRNVAISVSTLGNIPNGNWRLRAAVVERDVIYDSPPGSNGEFDFLNVFRKMLPGITGEAFTAAEIGEDAVFNYSYELDPSWDPSETYVIAFIQNDANREILNSGSTWDLKISYETPLNAYQQIEAGESANVVGTLNSLYEENTILEVTVTPLSAPESWSPSILLTLAGNLVELPGGSTTFEFEPGITSLGAKIATDETTAVGRYRFSIRAVGNENAFPIGFDFFINTGVKNLVVSSSFATEWENLYAAGLSEGVGQLTDGDYLNGINNLALNGIENIYYNIGWGGSTLTESMVAILGNFLSNGGNLLIAGQDIGWDTFTPAAEGGSGTQITRNFYNTYLQAEYIDDGGPQNSSLFPVANEEIFFDLQQTSVADIYGQNGFWPDQIAPREFATAIATYDAAGSRIAGIRAQRDDYKAVYFGIGLEMVGDEAVKNQILHHTELWFAGDVTGVEYDQAIQNLFMQQNYPNPSNEATTIQLNNIAEDMLFTLTDVTGKTVQQQKVQIGSNQLIINTSNLTQGTYLYQLVGSKGIVETQKMTVIH